MHIAFFGSPKIALDILTYIHEKYPVALVVTQPDKPVGRKQIVTPTPVKQFALDRGIPVETDLSPVSTLFKQFNIDLAIVVAYGELIQKQLLETPRFGFLNIHYSLLPKYRGAAPVQWALLNGDEKTGVTIMQLDEALDHGPIVATKEITIDTTDATDTLQQRLTETAKPVLLDTLTSYSKRQIPDTKYQIHSNASYSRQLTKDDGFIPFATLQKTMKGEKLTFDDLPKLQQEVFKTQLPNHPVTYLPVLIHNFIRAMHPWPVAWTKLPNGKRVKIYKSHINRSGTIHRALIIDEIQIEGKSKTINGSTIKNLLL